MGRILFLSAPFFGSFCILKRVLKTQAPKSKGVASVELALAFPLIFLLFLALVQIIIYIQSSTATQYAAFAAARAFQVYGDRTLASIAYPHVQGLQMTNSEQSVAEAAAEKVIFESLLWENTRIHVEGNYMSLRRVYEDGTHHVYDSQSVGGEGSVAVNFLGCGGREACDGGTGVEVRYCVPIVFPGAKALFGGSMRRWPCKATRRGRLVQGLSITKRVDLAREPLTP